MFVRRLASIIFSVMCFTLVISSKVLAQETQSNETVMPAVFENKVEAPAAPVALSEPAAQATETVTPAVPELPSTTPAVSATPGAMSAPAANTEKAQAIVAPAPANEKKTEWVWGEVVSADPTNKQIVIKHLDYESYEEVQTTLIINAKTLFENVTDLSGIKAGDHITVDYNIEGKNNIADLVVVEKGEAAPETSAKENPAETPPGPGASMGSTPTENVNMTAAPEPSNPIAPQAAVPLVAANQTTAVNATQTPTQ